MPSPKRPALTRCSILALCSVSMTGCLGTMPIVTTLAALDCASLIPPTYRRPVPPVPLLRVGATVGELGSALDGQTGRLDKANGRTADLVAIADTCQAQQAKVLAELKAKPWWAFWR